MKAKYEHTDEFETVVIISGQELLKQVKVQCKNRGYLLKMILSFYQEIIKRNKNKYSEEINSLRQKHEKKISKNKNYYEEELKKYQDKIAELLNVIDKKEKISKNFEEDIGFYKRKLQDTQRSYLSEQEI